LIYLFFFVEQAFFKKRVGYISALNYLRQLGCADSWLADWLVGWLNRWAAGRQAYLAHQAENCCWLQWRREITECRTRNR